MISAGIRTSDDVVFLADSVFSEETINKYHLFFIYDVKEYLNTLEKIAQMKAELFIPSHCEATKNMTNLVQENQRKVKEVAEVIYHFCEKEVTFEEVLKYIFDHYSLTMNANQYVLIGSTIRSYLSYLADENKITYEFKENKMIWRQV